MTEETKINVDYERYSKLEHIETDFEELQKRFEDLSYMYNSQNKMIEQEREKYKRVLKEMHDFILISDLEEEFESDLFGEIKQHMIEEIEDVI